MRDLDDPTTPPLRNAFADEFLRRFEREDEPGSAGEADVAGPWEVQPSQTSDGREAFGLWRTGERPDWGDPPAGVFRERSAALLAAAVRPLLGREPYYVLGRERWNGGFPFFRQGEAVAWIDLFDEDWAFGINLLERFTRSPEAMATLMEAAGPLALERAGSLLRHRIMEGESEGNNE